MPAINNKSKIYLYSIGFRNSNHFSPTGFHTNHGTGYCAYLNLIACFDLDSSIISHANQCV